MIRGHREEAKDRDEDGMVHRELADAQVPCLNMPGAGFYVFLQGPTATTRPIVQFFNRPLSIHPAIKEHAI